MVAGGNVGGYKDVKDLDNVVNGLAMERYFSPKDMNVYDTVELETGNIEIVGEKGEILFTQDVEFPKNWSYNAKSMTASKYFFGGLKTGADKSPINLSREKSIIQLLDRVSGTFVKWGKKDGYFVGDTPQVFGDEIKTLVLNQKTSFNSPVWFNVGIDEYVKDGDINHQKNSYIVDKKGKIVPIPKAKETKYPQCAACFILGVDDTIESITELAKAETLLFKYGSGSGTNLSPLRSSKENLSNGGRASGPLSFERPHDYAAGAIKSGGKTRRAAKMVILDIGHPDIEEFVGVKVTEKEKLNALVEYGFSDAEARETVAFQNSNFSVRIPDEFMYKLENNEEWELLPVKPSLAKGGAIAKKNAKDLFKLIAEGAYDCGDPGLQFDNTINEWNTCPNSGKIVASNPCSEYMFLNDSSCNLASLNLMKFVNEQDGSFKINDFLNAIRVTAIAQDLEVDNSSYPTKKIAENTHKFRPLGMGYANLGALLMYNGLPYDSDEARAVAASITALMTGKVYETSTEMAEKLGSFPEFKKNKEPMLNVIKKHQKGLDNIVLENLPNEYVLVLEEAKKVWANVLERGEKYGFRNAQATVLAPTGTIGFMMDCDTKGVEPALALYTKKSLSGGGTITIVNQGVESALKKLGYGPEEIKNIKEHIEKNSTIEGSLLREEHLPIFDCALKPLGAKRTIGPQGHVDMMAAVQPFLSGAISKTVNLPNEATVEDIEKIYFDAWKKGLKSIAIYRDGSIDAQPEVVGNSMGIINEEKNVSKRKKLPNMRITVTDKICIGGLEAYTHLGFYRDGELGEAFMTISKQGSTLAGIVDLAMVGLSMGLQHGVDPERLAEKMRLSNFPPNGLVSTGHHEKDDMRFSSSIVDHLGKLISYYNSPEGKEEIANYFDQNVMKHRKKMKDKKIEGEEPQKKELFSEKVHEDPKTIDGLLCPSCHQPTLVKRGKCDKYCMQCMVEIKGDCGGG
ncbi:MAG: vitamin B12-dependent ribonucleotide reductase [Candidatus Nanoarchaeia archaeon]|nr:vitamin B12-dependent ribonucleotide reductase [Candidatus Nanoarchaeia archaeon]